MLKQVKGINYHFEKAKTEYVEPDRPHSKSYSDFLQLSSSVHSRQQKRAILVLSQMINDYIELADQAGNLKCSEDLTLLINDPNAWYRLHSALITRSGAPRKKDLTDIFFKHYMQILNEVQQILDISLVPEKD